MESTPNVYVHYGETFVYVSAENSLNKTGSEGVPRPRSSAPVIEFVLPCYPTNKIRLRWSTESAWKSRKRNNHYDFHSKNSSTPCRITTFNLSLWFLFLFRNTSRLGICTARLSISGDLPRSFYSHFSTSRLIQLLIVASTIGRIQIVVLNCGTGRGQRACPF